MIGMVSCLSSMLWEKYMISEMIGEVHRVGDLVIWSTSVSLSLSLFLSLPPFLSCKFHGASFQFLTELYKSNLKSYQVL